jgi:protein-disulfide isomerase
MQEVKVTGSAGEARHEQTFYVSRDGRRIVQGQVYDIGENPFKPELDKLKTDSQPSLGSPGAPVALVLFTDFQCPYCREEAKMLRQNLISAYPKEVRLYFKDFPLESIHPWAKTAAIAGRCIFGQDADAFWEYHDWVFENQATFKPDDFPAKVMEYAGRKNNIDTLQLKRCLETRATEAEVNRSIEEGRSLAINGTPTLFINGRRIASQVGWPQLRAIIDFEIDYQKTAHNAGDTACCEVTLPSPIGR